MKIDICMGATYVKYCTDSIFILSTYVTIFSLGVLCSIPTKRSWVSALAPKVVNDLETALRHTYYSETKSTFNFVFTIFLIVLLENQNFPHLSITSLLWLGSQYTMQKGRYHQLFIGSIRLKILAIKGGYESRREFNTQAYSLDAWVQHLWKSMDKMVKDKIKTDVGY